MELDQTDASVILAKHVISAHAKDTNAVMSPLSIHVALGLIAAGSDGATLAQLLGFLKANSAEELHLLSSYLLKVVLADTGPLGGPLLSSANGIWVDRSFTFKPAFMDILRSYYRAAFANVDFQNQAVEVAKEVNAWADKETNGLIKEVVPYVDASTKLILANAVYFKGAWSQKFAASKTKEHDFFLPNGSSVKAPFMTSKKKQSIRSFDGFKVLGLPYEQGGDGKRNISMYIFLPDAKDGLPALIERASSESGFIQRHLPHSGRQVTVGEFLIPKFKIAFDFEASGVLKGMGLVLPFCSGGGSEKLYVSDMFQASVIEVNEEGTEAAAATRVIVRMCRKIEEKVDFVGDHPFLFVIREDVAGVVLFIGQLVNPLSS